ncbi:MAG: hypothetical protein H6983_09635 [Ectothiorhodospiraceae bacterium]|nr:hypothetical protein [Ectothiorhodospiraceae bacterium]
MSAPDESILKYSRAYTLTIEALETLCCSPGPMRERLGRIDREFFQLGPESLPAEGGVRENFQILKNLVGKHEGHHPRERSVEATLARAHHTVLSRMLRLVWAIHRDFSSYMSR